jgi:hypothetical protein
MLGTLVDVGFLFQFNFFFSAKILLYNIDFYFLFLFIYFFFAVTREEGDDVVDEDDTPEVSFDLFFNFYF